MRMTVIDFGSEKSTPLRNKNWIGVHIFIFCSFWINKFGDAEIAVLRLFQITIPSLDKVCTH